MSIIDAALRTPGSAFVKNILPAGTYKCQILDADLMRFYWGRSGVWGLMYVPTVRLVDMIPTGDPEIDETWTSGLEALGDWRRITKKYTMKIEVPGYAERIELGGIANNLNFPLRLTTPRWEELVSDKRGNPIMHPQASRFYLPARESATGVASGFVVDTLGLTPLLDVDLEAIITATLDRMLAVTFVHRQPNPQYEPRVEVENTSSV